VGVQFLSGLERNQNTSALRLGCPQQKKDRGTCIFSLTVSLQKISGSTWVFNLSVSLKPTKPLQRAGGLGCGITEEKSQHSLGRV